MHFSLPNTVITKLSNYQRECIIIVLRAWRRISKPPQVKQSGDVGTLWKSKRSTLKKHSVPITLKKHSGEASEALLAGRCTQLLLVQPSPAAGLLQRHQHFHCQHHHQWQRQQQQQQYLLHNTLLCCWLPLILFASNQDAMVWVEQVKEEGAGLTSRQITFVRTCLRLPWWQWWQWGQWWQIIFLRLLRQNNLAAVSAHLTPVGKSTEEKPSIFLNAEPKYQVQIGFCWFEHLWAPFWSHATKYDSCLSPIQSSQLLGQMNNEQWRRLFFCKFRGYYLRQNIRKRESRSKSVSKDISRLEFNPPWLLCLPKHWNREYENLKRILGLI